MNDLKSRYVETFTPAKLPEFVEAVHLLKTTPLMAKAEAGQKALDLLVEVIVAQQNHIALLTRHVDALERASNGGV